MFISLAKVTETPCYEYDNKYKLFNISLQWDLERNFDPRIWWRNAIKSLVDLQGIVAFVIRYNYWY